jgi:Spy/CpxP family protein refolding chaperone
MRNIWIRVMAACVLSGLAGSGQNIFGGQKAGGAPPTSQQARPARGRVERTLQRMSETLNLTDDQVAKIRPILQNRNKQLEDLRAKSSLPQGMARAKAREIRRSARQQIDQILTPEQREKQKAMRQGTRQRGSGRAGQLNPRHVIRPPTMSS